MLVGQADIGGNVDEVLAGEVKGPPGLGIPAGTVLLRNPIVGLLDLKIMLLNRSLAVLGGLVGLLPLV